MKESIIPFTDKMYNIFMKGVKDQSDDVSYHGYNDVSYHGYHDVSYHGYHDVSYHGNMM